MLSSEVGQGLATWLPNGYAVRKVLEDYVYELERQAGYLHVSTPSLARKNFIKPPVTGITIKKTCFRSWKKTMKPLS